VVQADSALSSRYSRALRRANAGPEAAMGGKAGGPRYREPAFCAAAISKPPTVCDNLFPLS